MDVLYGRKQGLIICLCHCLGLNVDHEVRQWKHLCLMTHHHLCERLDSPSCRHAGERLGDAVNRDISSDACDVCIGLADDGLAEKAAGNVRALDDRQRIADHHHTNEQWHTRQVEDLAAVLFDGIACIEREVDSLAEETRP